MGQQVIEQRATSAASADAIFGLLARGATWPTWSEIGSFELEKEGAAGGESVGAIRVFRTGIVKSRERVAIVEPGARFGYELLSGLPLRDYRAIVSLTPRAGGGCDLLWRSTFRPKIPGTGWMYRAVLGRFIGRAVRDLAAYAPGVERAPAGSAAA